MKINIFTTIILAALCASNSAHAMLLGTKLRQFVPLHQTARYIGCMPGVPAPIRTTSDDLKADINWNLRGINERCSEIRQFAEEMDLSEDTRIIIRNELKKMNWCARRALLSILIDRKYEELREFDDKYHKKMNPIYSAERAWLNEEIQEYIEKRDTLRTLSSNQ
jgi:hypothetical protein